MWIRHANGYMNRLKNHYNNMSGYLLTSPTVVFFGKDCMESIFSMQSLLCTDFTVCVIGQILP